MSGTVAGQKLFYSKKDRIIDELSLENKKLKDENSFLATKKLALEYDLEAKATILKYANSQIQKLEEELKMAKASNEQKEKYILSLEVEIRTLRNLLSEKNIALPVTSIYNENNYSSSQPETTRSSTSSGSSSSSRSSSYQSSSRSYSSSSYGTGGCSTSQCSATTKKGSRCKRMTTNCSGRCWQH